MSKEEEFKNEKLKTKWKVLKIKGKTKRKKILTKWPNQTELLHILEEGV